MRKAAESLIGEHDMLSFVSNPTEDITTIRNFSSAKVWADNDLVIVEMEANGFLPQQIRRTTGALMQVGQEKLSIEEFTQMIQCPRQGAASWSLPPTGLSLIKVNYCYQRLDENIYENI
jgi:tRNA pseudouridine38-40 synthase